MQRFSNSREKSNEKWLRHCEDGEQRENARSSKFEECGDPAVAVQGRRIPKFETAKDYPRRDAQRGCRGGRYPQRERMIFPGENQGCRIGLGVVISGRDSPDCAVRREEKEVRVDARPMRSVFMPGNQNREQEYDEHIDIAAENSRRRERKQRLVLQDSDVMRWERDGRWRGSVMVFERGRTGHLGSRYIGNLYTTRHELACLTPKRRLVIILIGLQSSLQWMIRKRISFLALNRLQFITPFKQMGGQAIFDNSKFPAMTSSQRPFHYKIERDWLDWSGNMVQDLYIQYKLTETYSNSTAESTTWTRRAAGDNPDDVFHVDRLPGSRKIQNYCRSGIEY
ncbi:hypothetical protein B0H11DRAFT_1912113 [Mycena galericulata]|nr:hypothetical protein B0H11DRAFT_1912113 [Mycena galericulata]